MNAIPTPLRASLLEALDPVGALTPAEAGWMAAAHLFLSRIPPPAVEALLARACQSAGKDEMPWRTTAHVHFTALLLNEKEALQGLVPLEARALVLLLTGQDERMENIFSSCVLPQWEDGEGGGSATC